MNPFQTRTNRSEQATHTVDQPDEGMMRAAVGIRNGLLIGALFWASALVVLG